MGYFTKTKFESAFDMLESIDQVIRFNLEDHFELVDAEELDLDSRCGTVWVSKDFIAVDAYNMRNLEYYGGFEYVGQDHITTVCDYRFYSAEEERVGEHIKAYYEKVVADSHN